ncbi:MAG: ABC transporter permease [Saprospiraceae bacterium]|nr:ABC transporter permease [Saprospiraceae bacterium]
MAWWKNKQLWPAFFVLGTLLLVALARDILANGRPLYCRIQGETFYPGLRTIWTDPDLPYQHPVLDSIQSNFLWRRFAYESAVFAPVAFSPGELPMSPDTTVLNARPGAFHPGPQRVFRHWLGTDSNGYDIAAGIVSGARVAVLTGLLAMGLAFSIGILLGAMAGFWSDDRMRLRRGQVWLLLIGLVPAWFYAGVCAKLAPDAAGFGRGILLPVVVFFLVLLLFNGAGKMLSRWSLLAKPVLIPVDLVVMRLAEVFTSIPGLLLIVALAAMLPNQSIWAMIALIGVIAWPGFARFIRSEMLRIRELDYISVARGIGLNEWRILLRHALPNALRPAYTALAFGIAEAIMIEAGLSFLGYGSSSMQGATWGSLLQNARSNPQLWWISLPPGLAICLCILALHRVGDALNERR